ncbi:hypothetical protein BLNAU_16375 [Blattamonas nauphoetae]|uniref:Uncharacterized protein n=1 Tax=Blattamonas nauphoetae TaxID=2049346 RepID=A0ABQ9XBS1_9EUKA|nr:hypothetical protein BLNAU_16375 [Blattamonas nauphoetae]
MMLRTKRTELIRSPLIELLIRTLEPSKIDFGDGDLHSITMNIVTSILRLGSAGEGEEELENEKTLNGMLLERVIMPLEEYLIILFRRVDDNQSEWYLESKGSVLEAFSRIAIADKGTQEFYWRIGMALKVFRLLADMENDMGQLSHLGALSRQFSSWSRAPVGLEEILKWFFGFMEEGVMDVVESRMYADFKRLATDVNALKGQNQTLRTQIDQQNQVISQLKSQIQQQNQTTLSNRVDQLERDRAASTQKIGNQQKQIDLQKDQLTESKSDVERLKKEIQRSTQMIEQQSQVIAQLKSQLQQQNEMIDGLNTRISSELRQIQQINSSISSTAKDLQSKIDKVNARVNDECLRKGYGYHLQY